MINAYNRMVDDEISITKATKRRRKLEKTAKQNYYEIKTL
jgi:hypothetical protein